MHKLKKYTFSNVYTCTLDCRDTYTLTLTYRWSGIPSRPRKTRSTSNTLKETDVMMMCVLLGY